MDAPSSNHAGENHRVLDEFRIKIDWNGMKRCFSRLFHFQVRLSGTVISLVSEKIPQTLLSSSWFAHLRPQTCHTFATIPAHPASGADGWVFIASMTSASSAGIWAWSCRESMDISWCTIKINKNMWIWSKHPKNQCHCIIVLTSMIEISSVKHEFSLRWTQKSLIWLRSVAQQAEMLAESLAAGRSLV